MDLDEDVLSVAKQLAVQRCVSLGKIVSDLMRQALASKTRRYRNGVWLLDHQLGATPRTLEMVNALRDEE